MTLKHTFLVLILSVACAIHAAGQSQAPVVKAPEATTNDARVLPTTDSSRSKPAQSDTVVASDSTKGTVTDSSEPKPNPQGGSTDEWQFALTPYLWIAGISGDAGVGNITVKVDSGITDSNVHLNFGFMSTFEARKNRWMVLTDLQYSNLGTDRPTPGPFFSNATADFKTFVLDPEVGYRILENPDKGNSVDILGGIRYWHLRSDLSLSGGILLPRSATATRGWLMLWAGSERKYICHRDGFSLERVTSAAGARNLLSNWWVEWATSSTNTSRYWVLIEI